MFRKNRQSVGDTGAKAPAYVALPAVILLAVGGCLSGAPLVREGVEHLRPNVPHEPVKLPKLPHHPPPTSPTSKTWAPQQP